LAPALRAELRQGFGASADGEDRFDAVVGLFGMLNVVLGRRPPGDATDDTSSKIEGWILGQVDANLANSLLPTGEKGRG